MSGRRLFRLILAFLLVAVVPAIAPAKAPESSSSSDSGASLISGPADIRPATPPTPKAPANDPKPASGEKLDGTVAAGNSWMLPVTILSPLVNLLMFAIIYLQLLTARKGRKTEDLFTLMKFLHQPEFRDARKAVLAENWTWDSSKNDKKAEKNAWIICSSFDFAGVMVQNKFVDRKVFFKYWALVIDLLGKKLEKFISEKEFGLASGVNKVTGKEYWPYFVRLIEEARSK